MGLFDSLFTPDDSDLYQRYLKANRHGYQPEPDTQPGNVMDMLPSSARASTATSPLLAEQPPDEYSSYTPSWRERIGAGVQDLMEGAGFNRRGVARQYGQGAETVSDFVPGVGQVLAGNDAYRAAQAGDTSGMMLGVLGALPAGKALSKADDVERGVLGEVEKTYRHPISSVKLKTPLEDIKPVYEDVDQMLPEKPFNIDDWEGSYVIPMRGDPTITGKTLKGLMGQMFEEPVHLPGGPQFARGPQQVAEGMGWASNQAPSTALSKRAAQLAKESGKPTLGMYMRMSDHSGDYAAHMGETINQMYKLNPVTDPAAHEALATQMATGMGLNKKTGKFEFPPVTDWPGFDKLTKEYIDANPNARKKLVKLLDTKKFQDLGFPASGVARYATTEPDLLNTPSHTSGASVVQFDPEGATTTSPIIPHPTYAQQNKATYVGRAPDIPLDVLYDNYSKGINPGHLSKFLETKPPSVLLDRPTIDRIKAYLATADGKKLGLAGAIAAGIISMEQADHIRGGLSGQGGSDGYT